MYLQEVNEMFYALFLSFVTALLLNCTLYSYIAYLSRRKYSNLFEMSKYPSEHRKFFIIGLHP